MKRLMYLFVSTALLLSPAAIAKQRPANYDLRPVITRAMTIDGQLLGNCGGLESPILNDRGDFAFTAYCDGHDRLFTSRRIVVTDGDHIDGKRIELIYSGLIAINNRGQVLFLAYFSEPDDNENWHQGLFLDRHLVSIITYDNDKPYTYALSDDGRVTAQIVNSDVINLSSEITRSASCPAVSGSMPRTLHSKREAAEITTYPIALTSNHCGQFLISLKLFGGEILVLLATPVTH